MKNFEDFMNSPEMDSAWGNATAGEFGDDLPDGHYVVHISKCEIKQSKNGRWQMSWDWQIVWDPKNKFKNRHIFCHDGITKVDPKTGKHEPNDIGMGIIKKRMSLLGIPAATKQQLPSAVSKAPGKIVLVKQRTKGQFTNYDFIGLVAQDLSQFKAPASLEALQEQIKSKSSGPATLPSTQTQITERPKLQFTDED